MAMSLSSLNPLSVNPPLSPYFLSSNSVASLVSLSTLSNAFLSCSSRSNGLISLYTSLSSPFPGAKPASLAPCASNSCVLLFAKHPSFVLCLWWRRNRRCVLGAVALGRRINVMFRSKHIVHHPVPLPGCGSSFSSLCFPSLWVGSIVSKIK